MALGVSLCALSNPWWGLGARLALCCHYLLAPILP